MQHGTQARWNYFLLLVSKFQTEKVAQKLLPPLFELFLHVNKCALLKQKKNLKELIQTYTE